ncbi:MAG: MFS transporter [Nitrososphaerota archaeon]|nr:MFS transporter [Nitrososphaerota archaeon]
MRFSFAFTVVALQYLVSSTLELGVISSAYPIMEMLTAMVFGLMSDRFGRKWIIVGALLASSAITFSFTLTVYFPALILIHALQGICAAAIVTGTLASLTDVAKASRRGREMGFYDFCTIGGYGFGFVFSILLVDGNVSNARFPFYAGAVIALVAAAFAAVLLKDISIEAKALSFANDLKNIAGNRTAITLIPTWFVLMMLIGVILTYTRQISGALLSVLPSNVGQNFLGASQLKIDGLTAILLLFGALLLGYSQTSLGGLSDRFGRPRLIMLGQISMAGVLTLLVAMINFRLSLVAAIPLAILFGAGLLAFTPAALAELADIAPTTGRGSTMGFYSVTVGAGTIFGPLLGGELFSRYGVSTGLSLFLLVGLAIMLSVLTSRLLHI